MLQGTHHWRNFSLPFVSYCCSLCFFALRQGVIQPLVNVKHEYAAFRADLVAQWSDMQHMVGSLAPAMQRLVDGNQRLAAQYVPLVFRLCALMCALRFRVLCIGDMRILWVLHCLPSGRI